MTDYVKLGEIERQINELEESIKELIPLTPNELLIISATHPKVSRHLTSVLGRMLQ